MEGNKDEALKCLQIGRQALAAGDRTRALKFLSKAHRLDPSLPVDKDLKDLNDDDDPRPKDPSPDPPPPSNHGPSLRKRPAANPRINQAETKNNSTSAPSYTEEQLSIVREIKKHRDFYAVLGLDRSCSSEDVRKAYRKLSLKVHPDKNSAPGAEDAFKLVSRAFQCLSDEQSRRRYDVSGKDDSDVSNASNRQHRHQNFNGFYEAEFDADEIFRSFFFGGMAPATTSPFGTFQFRTGGARGPQNFNGGNVNYNLRSLIQILPVVILILVNLMPSSGPVYSLSRQYPYEHKVVTARGVPYFVKSDRFEQEYPYEGGSRAYLEQQVERDFFGTLTQHCRIEVQRKHWGLTNQTPHCDMLRKYEEAAA